jgi:ribosome-binding protein aMBF1 (putative translation factor)
MQKVHIPAPRTRHAFLAYSSAPAYYVDPASTPEARMSARQIPIRAGRDLGRTITLLRGDRGLSQAALAEIAGLDQSALSRMETGALAQADRVVHVLRSLGATIEVTLDDPDTDDA